MRSDTTNTDGILVDITASPAAIAVGDLPTVSFQLSRVGRWLVDAVTTPFRDGEFLREDPTSLLVSMSMSIALSCSSGRLVAYRSADPVSISRFNVVSPTLTGVRYSLSFASGLATALPLSAASLMP